MRRIASWLCLLAFACSACASEDSAFSGFRVSEAGEVLTYRVVVSQQRRATGLGDPKKLASKVTLDLEEETRDGGYVVTVRDAKASGERTQVVAARRLVGRRIGVDRDGRLTGDVELFAGTDDLAAADVGLIHTLFGPVLPAARAEDGATWRTKAPAVRVPWATEPLAFTLDHEVVGSETRRELEAARVRSRALANVRFRLPLIVESQDGDGSTGSDDLIVNELFDSLFGEIDSPIEGVAAAIAAIPLAVAAPLLELGQALGDLFGGSDASDDEPKVPAVDLAGPLDLRANTLVWRADGRVLRSTGTGTARLVGNMPQLPGRAAELSGRELALETSWRITRDLTSPWPQPRPVPGRSTLLLLLATLAVAAGAAGAWWRTRAMRRRLDAPVRDTVLRPREPELTDA